jgi:hypothetical protein
LTAFEPKKLTSKNIQARVPGKISERAKSRSEINKMQLLKLNMSQSRDYEKMEISHKSDESRVSLALENDTS